MKNSLIDALRLKNNKLPTEYSFKEALSIYRNLFFIFLKSINSLFLIFAIALIVLGVTLFRAEVSSLPNIVLATLCLALVIRYQRQVLFDSKKWMHTRNPAQPSLESSADADELDGIYNSVSGCLWALVTQISMLFLTLIALDLFLANGVFTGDILRVLFGG